MPFAAWTARCRSLGRPLLGASSHALSAHPLYIQRGQPATLVHTLLSIRHRANFTSTPIRSESPSKTARRERRHPSPAPPPRSTVRTTLYCILFFAAGFAMAAAPAIPLATGLLTPPSDEDTLALFQPTTPTATAVNAHILSHPLSASLRANPAFVESRPHMKIPAAMRAQNLTGGVLNGPDKIEVPPLAFQDAGADLPSLVSISYLGPALCGHPGIVHGGLLATLLDEGLARACFPALPNGVGVTASLKIDYRAPCPAGSYVVLKAHTTKVDGRKAWVKGWIELLGDGVADGKKLVEAEALFVEPKGAASLPRIYSPSAGKKTAGTAPVTEAGGPQSAPPAPAQAQAQAQASA